MNTSDLRPARGAFAAALDSIDAARASSPGSPSRAALSLAVRGDVSRLLPVIADSDREDIDRLASVARTYATIAATVVGCYSDTPATLRLAPMASSSLTDTNGGNPIVCIGGGEIIDAVDSFGPMPALDWVAGRALCDLNSRRYLSRSRLDKVRDTLTAGSIAESEQDRLTDWLAHQLAHCRGRGDLVARWSGWAGFADATRASIASETAARLATLPPLPAAVAVVASIAAGVDVEIPAELVAAVTAAASRLDTGSDCLRTARQIVTDLAALLPPSPEEQQKQDAKNKAEESSKASDAAYDEKMRTLHDPAATEEQKASAIKARRDAGDAARIDERRALDAARNAARSIQAMPDPAGAGRGTRSSLDVALDRGDSLPVDPPIANGTPSGFRPTTDADGSVDLTPREVRIHDTLAKSERAISDMEQLAAAAIPALSRMAWLISQPPVVDRHRTSGRFDAANVASLVRGDGRCFARRPDDGEGRVCLTLLVDCSGSMGGWTMDSVKGAAFALASAFRSSRFVDVVVIGHDVMSRGTVDIHDCGDDARNIAGLDARGNNADGFAISAADSIARSRFPRHRHAMILLADGAPSDSGYHGCQALQHVRQTIANLGGAFHAIGWGIPNATARQQWGEAFTPIQSASDLVEPLVSAVGRIIQATREDA